MYERMFAYFGYFFKLERRCSTSNRVRRYEPWRGPKCMSGPFQYRESSLESKLKNLVCRAHYHAGVDATEPEGVGDEVFHSFGSATWRNQVEIACGIRML